MKENICLPSKYFSFNLIACFVVLYQIYDRSNDFEINHFTLMYPKVHSAKISGNIF